MERTRQQSMYAIYDDDQEYQMAISTPRKQSKFQFPLNSPKVQMVQDFKLPGSNEKSPPDLVNTKHAQKLIDHFEGVDEVDMRLDIEHFH